MLNQFKNATSGAMRTSDELLSAHQALAISIRCGANHECHDQMRALKEVLKKIETAAQSGERNIGFPTKEYPTWGLEELGYRVGVTNNGWHTVVQW